jgi:hypothetical protein
VWLAKHPWITLHFTPTGCSWLHLVEIFFGIITCQASRRGTFTSVPDLIGAIRLFIERVDIKPCSTPPCSSTAIRTANAHQPVANHDPPADMPSAWLRNG